MGRPAARFGISEYSAATRRCYYYGIVLGVVDADPLAVGHMDVCRHALPKTGWLLPFQRRASAASVRGQVSVDERGYEVATLAVESFDTSDRSSGF